MRLGRGRRARRQREVVEARLPSRRQLLAARRLLLRAAWPGPRRWVVSVRRALAVVSVVSALWVARLLGWVLAAGVGLLLAWLLLAFVGPAAVALGDRWAHRRAVAARRRLSGAAVGSGVAGYALLGWLVRFEAAGLDEVQVSLLLRRVTEDADWMADVPRGAGGGLDGTTRALVVMAERAAVAGGRLVPSQVRPRREGVGLVERTVELAHRAGRLPVFAACFALVPGEAVAAAERVVAGLSLLGAEELAIVAGLCPGWEGSFDELLDAAEALAVV